MNQNKRWIATLCFCLLFVYMQSCVAEENYISYQTVSIAGEMEGEISEEQDIFAQPMIRLFCNASDEYTEEEFLEYVEENGLFISPYSGTVERHGGHFYFVREDDGYLGPEVDATFSPEGCLLEMSYNDEAIYKQTGKTARFMSAQFGEYYIMDGEEILGFYVTTHVYLGSSIRVACADAYEAITTMLAE